MKKIILSSDSTSDLSSEYKSKYEIYTLPLYVHLDDEEYKDMVDITPEFIYKYYEENKVLPKTAAPSIGDYLEHFSKWNKDEYDIIHVGIGSGISASYQNAGLAAKELGNVYVIDSNSLSTGSGLLLIEARKLINEGKTVKEIIAHIEKMSHKLSVSFVIDSITYLREGGRLSGLQAFGANLLNIKPSIFVSTEKHAKMEVGKKYRGNIDTVTKKFITDTFSNLDNIDTRLIGFTHSGATEEQINACIDLIDELANPEELLLNKTSCTISSHCGYNTFGIIFFNK